MKKVSIFLISLFMFILPLKSVKAYTYAYIDATELGPRTCPSTSCSRVYSDEGNIIWLYRPRVVEVIDYSGSWAKIRFNWYGFTYEGYILREYLGGVSDTSLDENYKNELRAKGFPESYVDSLAKMHMIHPNWNFEVSNTNVSLEDAVNNEYSPVYKNLISTTNTNQLSTDGSAYSNGSFVQFEPGWYAVSRDTLKYYMDPRNFLDDNSIFMFEQLSYKDVSVDDVQKLLNNTFMSGTYSYSGYELTYAQTFVQAGINYNVNPIHLAARVLQEQGSSGSATSVMSYNGQNYYNYFNFNATGSSASEIINNALSYAISHNWNSPFNAIMGGASALSNGYISNNQDTLYYQKFNIVGSGQYWHQYMSNIQAPYTESYSSYKSYYNSGLINTGFTFKIPVYTDMPKATVISTKSDNNNLSTLSISNCTLNPNFDSAITSYVCTIDSSITSVNVSATSSDSKATISNIGDINISDKNEIKIDVTAESGKVKTYTISLYKEKKQETTNTNTNDKVIESLNLSVSYKYLTGVKDNQDITSFISKVNNDTTIQFYDSKNNKKKSGLIATGDKIVINNNLAKPYTIVIMGDVNGDGKVGIGDYAKIKSYIQKKTSMEEIELFASDVNSDHKIGIGDYAKIKSYIQKEVKSLN